MSSGSGVVYEEYPLPGGRRKALISIVGLFLIGVALLVAGRLALLAVTALSIAVIALIVLLSAERYRRIQLYQDRLVVGRDTLMLALLDRGHGTLLGTDVLDDSTRSSLEIGFSNRRGDIRIMGGAYGRMANGSKWVVLRQLSGQRVVVASRKPDEFTAAMSSVLN